jgi:alanine dehydrogenase
MRVGCPKEIKNHEYRVGLTPGAVREYVAHGHEVLIESKAGSGIGADDNAYIAAGARIVGTAREVFEKSDMVVKVKEPQPQEWAQLRDGQILYTYLHLAPDPDQTNGCWRLE